MDCRILTGNLKNVVRDNLEGLTCMNQEVVLLEFGNVIVRRDFLETNALELFQEAVMYLLNSLEKECLLRLFKSFLAPPSKVILHTIRELSLNHIKGVLIIVPAHSGDMLNFGLATERAINDNIRVKLLSVSDDCNRNVPKICRIGLSGIILVNKIAGALSEKEKSLADINTYCERVLQNISSFGIILKNFQKDNSQDGEPAAKRPKLMEIGYDMCNTIIENIINIKGNLAITDKLNLLPGESIVVLFNNTGALGKTEEYIFIKEFIRTSQLLGITIQRFYVGNFFKCSRSIDMSVTILKIFDKDILEYLDYPCSAPGWKNVNQSRPLVLENTIGGNLRRKDRLAPPIRGPKLSNRLANILLLCTEFACDALISCERQLNTIDSERGDGDTGTRLKIACEVLMKRMKDKKVITNYPFTFFESLSRLLEATVGGSIGCIYSTIFEAAANCFGRFNEHDEITL
ncbi:hypothetical protein NQ318_000605 [Aromia moschata]|uniref:Triokinase/FMN cyclase n=1 Tax=Aromia moschata TaxID=1265417 RepID=A0AAV8X1J7_9CUCU|nr:hypothetical protein NQ318_000605 [Aromia moschata]